MRICVLYFGLLKETVGRTSEEIEVQSGASLADLMAALRNSTPALEKFEHILALSVNQEFAQLSHKLQDGDEVALLPPVSGGLCGTAVTGCAQRASIVTEPIDQALFLKTIKNDSDGAMSLFDGIVRNNTRGRRTEYLIYEAYEGMALKQMEQLAAEAIEKYKVRDVRIVHRLGRLEIGETSVLIVVSSAHRAAAMDACRWLIDTLKKTVPIWKKEYFADGAVWADGEPFPEELRPAATPEEPVPATNLNPLPTTTDGKASK